MGLIERAVEILNALPVRRVDEYGFGSTVLANGLRAPWNGFDFSEVAVGLAKSEGRTAAVVRCGEARRIRRSYVCAIAVLPNLQVDERETFLERVHGSPHAVFGVKRHDMQRGPEFSSPEAFAEYLKQWWPHVEAEEVGRFGILAHAMTQKPEQRPILTIGTSTILDFHGVTYTLASLLAHHGTFGGRVEYVVVDNHPTSTTRLRKCPECATIGKNGPTCSACELALEDMSICATSEGARYIRWSEKQGTYPGKNQLKEEARGDWVLTMDSHVLLTPGAIEEVLELIERDPNSDDLFQFATLFKSGNPKHAGRPAASDFRKQQFIYHRDGEQRGGVYGWTGEAKKVGLPYPIAAMITSCYLVRRAAWFSAKGYDPILGHYGGWEGPLQLKWYLMGRQVRSIRYSTQERMGKAPEGYLYHWHLFNHFKRLANATGRFHTGHTKMRNFAASSAVIGGEKWVRRHCQLKGWNFGCQEVQEGLAAGLKLRPWMVKNLADPEWEDIAVFFEWMKAEGIPGHLESW